MSKKTKVYNPKKYWEQRGKSYTIDFANIEIPLEIVYKHLSGNEVKSVLDIGSGWGRSYLLLRNLGYNRLYKMCDISTTMIDHCEMYTGLRPTHISGNVLPFLDNEFDSSLLVYVAQHVSADEIDKFVSEVCRVSSKFVYIVDGQPLDDNARHCFSHNYHKLFGKRLYSMTKENVNNKTSVWIFEK